ncbi:CRTAC1 family protein [bacterium]|nr:CRTAC1 family protein [bacterium]
MEIIQYTLQCRNSQMITETANSIRTTVMVFFLFVAILFAGCEQRDSPPSIDDMGVALFTEITSQVGFDDTPESWPAGTYSLSEIKGSGVALFDYDNDGDLDILHPRFSPPHQPHSPAPNRLFQQQPDGTFLDVTENAGIGDPGRGDGVAVADVDNDGDLDVYFTNFGRDSFYLNNGDGTFVNATSDAGFSGEYWSTSAAFADYDRDGHLDLYVVHYVVFDPTAICSGLNDVQGYCGPIRFKDLPDTLYRNNGDGTFTDVTKEADMIAPGSGLGLVCLDLTGDGWIDFYVANDGEANQLWVNNRDGTFTDEALLRGVAFNFHGRPEASMGVTVGDVNGNGKLDLFMTHLKHETNTLYIAEAYGQSTMFADESDASGLSIVDMPFTSFGCGFFDFDNDGDLDLAVANGRVIREQVLPGANLGKFWNPYAEPNLLFQNDGHGNFTDVSKQASAFTARVEISRGLAFGDIDNDGDIDMVMVNHDNMLRVFRNDAPPVGNHWLLVRTMIGNRNAIGAKVTVLANDKKFVRLALPGYSYACSNDPRAHFGLGKIDKIDAIEVVWPDDTRERFKVNGINRELTVRKGEGESL